MRTYRVAILLAAAAAACGCSMQTPYFVRQSLLQAGFSKAEAKCAVNGVTAHLTEEQMWSLRPPLTDYIMLDRPPGRMDAGQLLDWLKPQVAPETHQVLAHYATHCRSAPAAAAEKGQDLRK
jgi:uncharacterized protein YqcC (DUF446 family)